MIHGSIGTERGEYAANRAVQLARAVYNKAKIWKLFVGENPFASITLFTETPRNRFLTQDETTALLGRLLSHPNADLRDFGVIALFTGARKANVLAMQWCELNLTEKAATWTIPSSKTKNSSAQVIPLGPSEVSILSERLLRATEEAATKGAVISEFVFPGSGKSGHCVDLKRSWTKLREELDLTDITIHDLRRSLASAMASRNIEPQVIRKALNHKDLKTTMSVYALVNGQAERDARSAVHDDWLENAGLKKAESKVTHFRPKAVGENG
jgi:integrase